jgi:hypothetical protein
MSLPAEWVPPRPTYHLRVFVISLFVLTLCLLGMLFGVRMEAVVPATGTITARDLTEVRARLAGLVEPGWYEGQVELDGQAVQVRLDTDGNGLSDPAAAGKMRRVQQGYLIDRENHLPIKDRVFHRLQPGDVLWPGQPLATVRDETLRLQLSRLEDQFKDQSQRGEPSDMLKRECDRLRDYHAQGIVHAPEWPACWLVLEVRTAPLQKVKDGDVIAAIVPADPTTRQPAHLIARLEIEEKHWAGVSPRAKVRLSSSVYHPRKYGHAEATIERLEPLGELTASGERRFYAVAPITRAPFELPLGSSFQAEIVVGRKLIYRIILEH